VTNPLRLCHSLSLSFSHTQHSPSLLLPFSQLKRQRRTAANQAELDQATLMESPSCNEYEKLYPQSNKNKKPLWR
jgi:hypothetical protein